MTYLYKDFSNVACSQAMHFVSLNYFILSSFPDQGAKFICGSKENVSSYTFFPVNPALQDFIFSIPAIGNSNLCDLPSYSFCICVFVFLRICNKCSVSFDISVRLFESIF